MSRYYGMGVEIIGAEPERVDDVKSAAEAEWSFGDWSDNDGVLRAYGESRLVGGESEDEFAQRLAEQVWKANGGYCQVTVSATYLEDLPCEQYSFDEDDYQRLVPARRPTEQE